MPRSLLNAYFGVSLVLALASPLRVQAMHRDTRSVLVAGSYGIAGGTLVGLATLPMTNDTRSIFIGSTVGLYLGLAVGFYYICNRDDPGNPLAFERGPAQEIRPVAAYTTPALLEVSVPVLKF